MILDELFRDWEYNAIRSK